MSAWIVHPDHIDLLMTYVGTESPTREKLVRHLAVLPLDELGRILWEENYRSVNHRYRLDDETPPYSFSRVQELLDADEDTRLRYVMAAVRCYRYQSCESPDWNSTPACAITEAIQYTAQTALLALYGVGLLGIDDVDLPSEAWGWTRERGITAVAPERSVR